MLAIIMGSSNVFTFLYTMMSTSVCTKMNENDSNKNFLQKSREVVGMIKLLKVQKQGLATKL